MNLGDIDKGTYVSVKFSEDTLSAIDDFIGANKIPNAVPSDKIHCTVVYSRVKIPYVTQSIDSVVSTKATTKVFETRDGKRALVLALDDAEELSQRHKYASILGATYDFPDYIPHVTVSYDIGKIDFPEGKVVDINFRVVSESVEDLDLDWKDKL